LEESIHHDWLPDLILFSESLSVKHGKKLADRFKKKGVQIESVSAGELRKLSDTEQSQGIVGIFTIPDYHLNDAYKEKVNNFLLIDNVSDPGNAGTLVRSACAFGFDMILATETSVDIYNPKVVRSSAGAIFGIPCLTIADGFIENLKKTKGIPLLAADLKGDDINAAIDKKIANKGFILAIGSESHGISNKFIRKADYRIRIRHSNRVESLNAAVAGSIIMRHLYDLFSGRKN